VVPVDLEPVSTSFSAADTKSGVGNESLSKVDPAALQWLRYAAASIIDRRVCLPFYKINRYFILLFL